MAENNQRGLADGPVGESLFWRPFIQYFKMNELPDLFKTVEGLNDHRLLAIVTALLIETRVDKIHSSFLPKYSRLTEKNEFTFSMKINLLEALNFVPVLITTAAHCLRRIRNEFAHNLDKQALSDIDQKFIRPMRSLCDDVYRGKEKPFEGERPLFEAFKQLSFFCIVGLDLYIPNVTLLRREISKTDYVAYLERLVGEMNKAALEEITSRPPTSIERQGDLKIERYERGVVKVSSLPSAEKAILPDTKVE